MTTVTEEEKRKILEAIGTVLAGKTRIIKGNRVKILGYDSVRGGIAIQYLDDKKIAYITTLHDARRLI